MKKKLFALFILVLPLLLLTGCFNRPPSLEDRIVDAQRQNKQDTLSYTGVIEPLEFDVYRQGTHQIRTDDNELIAIQSREIDLNRYLEKRVMIKGYYGEVIGNAAPALNVTELVLDSVYTEEGEPQLYENKAFGFRFTYPYGWELIEQEKELKLLSNGHDWVSLEVVTASSDLDEYVRGQEEEEGTPVTIGAQRSLRFIDGPAIRLYIPNPSKSKIYKIIFNEAKRDVGQEKEAFYDLLESFEPLYFASRTGDPCGGRKDLKCPEDYRCELDSGEKDAEGVCVPVDATVTEQPCPFIAPPQCDHYRVSQYSTLGCPTRYDCVEGVSDLSPEEAELDVDALRATIEHHAETLLSAKAPTLIQLELSKEAGLIAVIYQEGDEKLKTLFSFSPSANEFNFIEKAHFEMDDGGDWELLSGKNEQQGVNKTVIELSG